MSKKVEEAKAVMIHKPKSKKGKCHVKKNEAVNLFENMTVEQLEQQKFGEKDPKKLYVIDLYIKRKHGKPAPAPAPVDDASEGEEDLTEGTAEPEAKA